MIESLLVQFGGWFAGAGALFVALFAVFYGGKNSGKSQADLKNTQENAAKDAAVQKANSEQIEKVTTNATNVQSDVSGLNDTDVNQRLHDKWNG